MPRDYYFIFVAANWSIWWILEDVAGVNCQFCGHRCVCGGGGGVRPF